MKRLVMLILFAAALFLTAGTQAAIVAKVSDGFDDGGLTNGGDALDVPWWKVKDSSGGSLFLTVRTDDGSPGIGSGNALEVESTSNAHRTIIGDFDDGREITLSNVGDTVTLSFDFRILNVPPTNSANDYRFGLFNNGGTRVTYDLGGDDTMVDDDPGYNVVLSTGTENSARLYYEGGSSTLLGGNDRSELMEDSSFGGINDNLKHTARLTLTRNEDAEGNPTMDVKFVLDEGTGGEKSMTDDHTGGNVVFTFNEIGFSNHDDNMDCIIDNVVVGIVDPVVDAGDDRYARLADAGAVDLVGEIVNYDPLKSYTYTWSGAGVSFTTLVTVVDPCCPTTATFPGVGEYTLTLEVTNETDSASTSDTVTATVVDSDTSMVGHWKLDTGSGNTVADSSIGPFNYPGTAVAADWQDGWVGCALSSLQFDGDPNTRIAIPSYATSDPNGLIPDDFIDNITYGITIAAWVKTAPTGSSQSVIIKDDVFELRIQDNGSVRLKVWTERSGYNMTDTDESELGANMLIADGNWRHVAATYSVFDEMGKVYVDGILINSEEYNDLIWLAEPDYADLTTFIGWNYVGGIDDVQLYNYALDSDAIETLAAMGDKAPLVSAGPDEVYQLGGTLLQLQGFVGDLDSSPTIGWTVIRSNPGSVTFTDDADPATTVEFSPADPNTFELQLSATDTLDCGTEVVEVIDTVFITTILPTCADVIANGLTLALDITGPVEGQPDCYVDMYELVYLAKSWLTCNDPENQLLCEWPW